MCCADTQSSVLSNLLCFRLSLSWGSSMATLRSEELGERTHTDLPLSAMSERFLVLKPEKATALWVCYSL